MLRLRFRDLHLGRPRRAALRRAIRRLHAELEARGIVIRPHVWFAEEWFSPSRSISRTRDSSASNAG
jgi:hypothetical protein